MKYRVSGTNRETGARMILEFEASNRAMAERKATHSGMGEVLHCEEVADPNSLQVERPTRRGEFDPPGRSGKHIGLIIIIAVLAFVGWVMWKR
ncbi:hypothetical protein BH09PLA1_BH09PLA1_08960 [soil metagenome]